MKIVYWITTGLFSLWMGLNAYAYLFSDEAKRICAHFGFPDYFRIELAIAKIIGIIILLLPIMKFRVKEWAYAGFFFAMTGAIFSHIAAGNAVKEIFPALLLLVLTLISWYFRPADRKIISVNFNK